MVHSRRVRGHRVTILATALAVAFPATGWSWGGATHHYIAQNYSKHLPAYMDGLKVYDNIVDQKVNDPDVRRPYTPGESYRHYIDIDYYYEFFLGMLPHDRAALEAEYGAAAVLNTGVLPWAVADVVATLTQQFRTQQWSGAATTIADLCHYVGDATQPLHCTQNYDGQLTGNFGIHSRYETSMMYLHIGDLHTSPLAVAYYPSPVDAMFDIIGASWTGVSTIIQADNTAMRASGGQINSIYYDSLWANTESLTRARIDAATVATASFAYTAWINAGRPPIPGSSASFNPVPVAGPQLEAGPSPFRDALNIRFAGAGPLSVDVFDVRGARVGRVVDQAPSAGSVSWQPTQGIGPGLYFIRLTGPRFTIVRRVTRLE